MRIESLEIISPLFDLQIGFAGNFQIKTFFNWSEENQWTIFLPDGTNISIDGSSNEEIKKYQDLSKSLVVKQQFQEIDLMPLDSVVVEVTYDQEHPTIHFKNGYALSFQNSLWRVEENEEYLAGNFDERERKIDALSKVMGKKIEQIEIADGVDATFQYQDQYVMKTFVCSREPQWAILQKKH